MTCAAASSWRCCSSPMISGSRRRSATASPSCSRASSSSRAPPPRCSPPRSIPTPAPCSRRRRARTPPSAPWRARHEMAAGAHAGAPWPHEQRRANASTNRKRTPKRNADMNLAEYATYDALGLAELVARKQVSPKELAQTASAAVSKIDQQLKSVVELYPDRIETLDEASLGSGPFRGVPLLIKDVFGHEKGRKIESGSRLCQGMTVETGTYFVDMLQASVVHILGRSAPPEYSMSASTESVLFGNTSNPWKQGYSAGGSSGGAQAAVLAGIVPIAHGSDIGGSIRIPASWCGGVGLKPSRMRVSVGPVVAEGGG